MQIISMKVPGHMFSTGAIKGRKKKNITGGKIYGKLRMSKKKSLVSLYEASR
jgi:hypothetical protein